VCLAVYFLSKAPVYLMDLMRSIIRIYNKTTILKPPTDIF